MGYQEHNPEYRRQSEDQMLMYQLAQQFQDNPTMLQYYLNSPEGQKIWQRLGMQSSDQLMQTLGGMDTGMPTIGQYKDLYSQVGGINPNIDYAPQTYNPFQFSFNEITPEAEKAYAEAQLAQEEAAQRSFGRLMAQMGSQVSQRGFRPGSGIGQMAGTELGRDYMNQMSDISRNMALTRAQGMTDIAKFNAQQNMQRQAAQSGENRFGAQFGEGQRQFGAGLQQYAKDYGLKQAGMQSDLLGQQQNRAMTPYNMQSQYFYNTANLKGPQNKSWWQKGLEGVGTVAGAASTFMG